MGFDILGTTERTRIKEKSKIKKKKIASKLKQASIDATKENRNMEIVAHKETLNYDSGNMKEVAHKALDTANQSMNKLKEIASTSMHQVSDVHYENQRKTNKLTAMYQKSLQHANKKATELKIKTEIYNEFSQKILNFAQLQAGYQEKIANTENTLKRNKEKLHPQQNALQEIMIEIRILDSDYDKYQNAFEDKIHLIEKLKFEYQDSMKKSKYEKEYEKEKRELKKIQDNCAHCELILLKKEKNRLIKEEEMEPILLALQKNKMELEHLKNEHTKLISIETHKLYLSQPQLKNNNIDKQNEVIIEGEICENSETLLLLK